MLMEMCACDSSNPSCWKREMRFEVVLDSRRLSYGVFSPEKHDSGFIWNRIVELLGWGNIVDLDTDCTEPFSVEVDLLLSSERISGRAWVCAATTEGVERAIRALLPEEHIVSIQVQPLEG